MMGFVLVLIGWRGMSFFFKPVTYSCNDRINKTMNIITFSTPIGGKPRNNYKTSLLHVKQFYCTIKLQTMWSMQKLDWANNDGFCFSSDWMMWYEFFFFKPVTYSCNDRINETMDYFQHSYRRRAQEQLQDFSLTCKTMLLYYNNHFEIYGNNCTSPVLK